MFETKIDLTSVCVDHAGTMQFSNVSKEMFLHSQEFRNSLRPASAQGRLERQQALSKTSLNSTLNSTNNTPKSTPAHGMRPPPAAFTVSNESSKRPTKPSASTRTSMYGNEVRRSFSCVGSTKWVRLTIFSALEGVSLEVTWPPTFFHFEITK